MARSHALGAADRGFESSCPSHLKQGLMAIRHRLFFKITNETLLTAALQNFSYADRTIERPLMTKLT